MEVWLFGNPDLEMDATPIALCDALRKKFPNILFEIKDPLDEWNMPDELLIIDTVVGIPSVRIFTSLDDFQHNARVTMHDFDLGMQLTFLKKLNKLPPIRIIGVPPTLNKGEALSQITSALQKCGL